MIGNTGDNTKPPGLVFLILGAIFPLFVVLLELSTGMCSDQFFDPIPTIWHILLVAFVPVANLTIWFAPRAHWTRTRLLGLVNGAAIGVSLYYTLLFLPLMPLAVIGLLWGIGILPMAPLFSLIAAIRGYRYLKRSIPEPAPRIVPGTVLGLVVFLLLIVAIELPAAATRVGMRMAVSQDEGTRSAAIKWLRILGNQDLLLRSCYFRTGSATDILTLFANLGQPVTPQQCREVYYRVTGVPYNAMPLPSMAKRRGGIFNVGMFDPDQGGKTVANRVEGLSLESSRLDGSVDGPAGLAYVEWTLEFKNSSARIQEARAQIALPPGGFISRATLWVDGEEREAAFAARGEARKAYERVVQRKRDPLLVTTNGPDRILVQCFPVPPQGGVMKVRLGITAPLVITETDKGALRLPYFVENNFLMNDHKKHLVWIESKNRLSTESNSLVHENPAAELFALRGRLTDSELMSVPSILRAAGPVNGIQTWADDEVAKNGRIVVQTAERRSEIPPERLVVVVDGSFSMRDFGKEVAAVLHAIPDGIPLDVIVASDIPARIGVTKQRGLAEVREAAAKQLTEFNYIGGCDNIPALAEAWEIAVSRPNTAIVWVHGPQPVRMDSVEILRQKEDRREGNARLYCIEVVPGKNVVVEHLDGMESLRIVPRMGGLKTDLERLFSSWRTGAQSQVLVRKSVDRSEIQETARKTSMHLVRLWGHDEVMRLSASKKQEDRQAGVKIAAAYNLVTPLTGAVVLESAEQYKEAGLTPATAAEVPTIPEPETWILICVSAGILLWLAYTRRRTCQGI